VKTTRRQFLSNAATVVGVAALPAGALAAIGRSSPTLSKPPKRDQATIEAINDGRWADVEDLSILTPEEFARCDRDFMEVARSMVDEAEGLRRGRISYVLQQTPDRRFRVIHWPMMVRKAPAH
jgi:hypothetical protein